MALTKLDKEILKLFIDKEMEAIAKESQRLLLVNAPFFNKLAVDFPDLPFLKRELLYQEYLQKLRGKL